MPKKNSETVPLSKGVHVKMDPSTHSRFKLALMKVDMTMQEFYFGIAGLIAEGDEMAMAIRPKAKQWARRLLEEQEEELIPKRKSGFIERVADAKRVAWDDRIRAFFFKRGEKVEFVDAEQFNALNRNLGRTARFVDLEGLGLDLPFSRQVGIKVGKTIYIDANVEKRDEQ